MVLLGAFFLGGVVLAALTDFPFNRMIKAPLARRITAYLNGNAASSSAQISASGVEPTVNARTSKQNPSETLAGPNLSTQPGFSAIASAADKKPFLSDNQNTSTQAAPQTLVQNDGSVPTPLPKKKLLQFAVLQKDFVNVALPKAPQNSTVDNPRTDSPSMAGDNLLINQQNALNQQLVASLQLYEAHWQGGDIMELTAELKKQLNYPMDLSGPIVGEVTLNAQVSGMMGGDVILAIDGMKVANLRQLKEATLLIQANTSAKVKVWRKGQVMVFQIKADENLGIAQMESAPMIMPGQARPHPHRGACTDCHLVRTIINAEIQPDPDDVILQPRPVRLNGPVPHENRGPCKACHIVQ